MIEMHEAQNERNFYSLPVDADVVPIQVSGTLDTEMTSLTTTELTKWALSNLWKDGKEGAYAVRHGTRPLCDFGVGRSAAQNGTNVQQAESNYFERVFPVLFPYGEGGPETMRSMMVDFGDHIKWLLDYHNRRFRTHETFSFIAFGILQRRQVLASARVQMQRKNFERDARLLMTIRILRYGCFVVTFMLQHCG